MSKKKSTLFSQDQSNWIDDIDILASESIEPDNFLSVYASGYKEAANLIAEQIMGKRVYKKYAMIYPIMYLYRHYLELQLKNLIRGNNGKTKQYSSFTLS
ncbi:MAG: hypothetical protein ACJAZX_000994 [Rickettsiales bacterium]|jgi:hypothetical protein